MSVDPLSKTRRIDKKIPRSILIIGTFQVVAALSAFLGMVVSGQWSGWVVVLALGYGVLGAGLLAMMEWARFVNVVLHATILPLILWYAVNSNRAGLLPTLQLIIAMVIFYTLSRPHLRARFRGRTDLPAVIPED